MMDNNHITEKTFYRRINLIRENISYLDSCQKAGIHASGITHIATITDYEIKSRYSMPNDDIADDDIVLEPNVVDIERDLVYIPISILEQVIDIPGISNSDSEIPKSINFGTFPQNRNPLVSISNDDFISYNKNTKATYHINKLNYEYDCAYVNYDYVSCAVIDKCHRLREESMYITNSYVAPEFLIAPVKWNLYPERNLAVTDKVLFSRQHSEPYYLETKFIDGLIDEETANKINNKQLILK